jgi:hypothetical protein
MAKFISAHRDLGPKLKLNNTVHLDQLAAWMSMRTNMNKGTVMMMLQELNEAILYFNSQGTPVKLEGIGTFAPKIDRDGNFSVYLRPDVGLRRGLNVPRAYTGQINNKANIGIDNERYKAMWDLTHPDDPLEV